MSPSIAATRLLLMLGVAPAAADCLSARQALLMVRYGVGEAVVEETAPGERYIAARSGFEAARLRREREERRVRHRACARSGGCRCCRYATRSCASLRRAGHPGICRGHRAVRFEKTGQVEVGRSRQDRRCRVRRAAGIRGCRVAGFLRLLVPTLHLARFGAAVTGPPTTRSVLGRCAL